MIRVRLRSTCFYVSERLVGRRENFSPRRVRVSEKAKHNGSIDRATATEQEKKGSIAIIKLSSILSSRPSIFNLLIAYLATGRWDKDK
jgi:hypothetical protein